MPETGTVIKQASDPRSVMASAQQGTVTIHATDQGDGQPLVFLHGAWVSSEMWTPQVEYFTPEHRVVTIDTRGHGKSDGGTSDYSIDRFATDLHVAIESLDLAPPVLCGLSLGGLVAMRYAREHPVNKLVLADTVQSIPPLPIGEWQKHAYFPKPLLYQTLRALGPAAAYRLLLRGIEGSLGRPWLATTSAARNYALREIDELASDEFIKVFDALYDYRPIDPARLDPPTLVLHGDHEAPPVKAQSRRLARQLDAERVPLEDAGHLANLDNPAAFNAALADFLPSAG